ncbi:MAG: AraC family transcriptional regulator ligand-binding domain-containing protein [Myxococcota bacterium]
MARPPLPIAAPTRSVPLILAAVRARGVDVAPLARRLGLPLGAADRETVSVTPAGFEALLAALAEATGEPLLALSLPAALQPATFQASELAIQASATVRAAFERTARYAPLFYAHLRYVCESDADELRMRTRAAGPHAARFALASLLVHTRRLCADPVVPARVWFAGEVSPGALVDGLAAFFGTDRLAFGGDDAGLALPAAVVDRRTGRDDPRLLATATRWADEHLADHPAGDAVAAAVRAVLRHADGPLPLEAVARRLGLSPRTLQRRLAAEGTSWSGVAEDLRRDEVLRLLDGTALPLAEIAARTGFCDAPTLSRAFRRWTGVAPGAWRRRG